MSMKTIQKPEIDARTAGISRGKFPKRSRTRALATRTRACMRILGRRDDDATWRLAFSIAGQLADFEYPRGTELAKAIRAVRVAGGRVPNSDVMVACNCDSLDEVGLVFPEVIEAMTDGQIRVASHQPIA